MALTPGTRLGPYEVLAPLGAGGMGEVFRARDTRLGRDVAIKVLPDSVSGDPHALARFESEARAVAALSHPNILALHDVGESGGVRYTVTELLEGETLRASLTKGPLPVRRALEIAAQVAEGLAVAHENGIVHRDVKPENLFLTKEGRVKLLDFGLVRHRPAAGAGSDTESPTASVLTGAGSVVGTAAYMSPEQARGAPVDHRSDQFSLGVVLYEMVAGRRPFVRATVAETLTAILREEPEPLEKAAPNVPAPVRWIVERCLSKEAEGRYESTWDLLRDLSTCRFHLNEALNSGVSAGAALPAASTSLTRRILWAAALVAGIALGAVLVWLARPPAPEPVRVRSLTFSGQDGEPSASPDGRVVAFTSTRDGVSRIWIKQISGGEAPLTSGPDRCPRFSPDGSSVLFLRGGGSSLSVYRVSLVGGEPRRILDDVMEADWSPDGRRIAFLRTRPASGGTESMLGVADVQGGQERILTAVREYYLLDVRWSPDGRTIAAIKSVPVGFAPGDRILLVDASSGGLRELRPTRANRPLCGLTWSGSGNAIVFGQPESAIGDSSGALARVIRKNLSSGGERTLFWAPDLFPTIGGSRHYASFDILGPGRLVFDEMSQRLNLREVPAGTSPSQPERILTTGSSRDRQPTYSPDGEWILFSSNRSGNLDLWALSTRSGALKQLTDDPAQDWDPAFTPDGKHILWSSDRGGHLEIWMANADGSGARQLSHDGADAENPTTGSDGEWIVYGGGDPAKSGIWKVRADGSGATRLVPGFLSNAEVSPDGRFATFLRVDLFQSTTVLRVVEVATGRVLPFEIRAPYQVGPEASRILVGRSRWRPDGKAIAWIGEDENGLTGIYAQDFGPQAETTSTRRKLAGFSRDYVTESFAYSPDGKKLAISTLTRSGALMIAEGVPDVAPPVRAEGPK
jgi:serine/threonine protein kinase/Tol biopolymer transport system component